MTKRSRVNTAWDYAVHATKYDGNIERLKGSGARTSRRARILDEGQIAAALRQIRETSNSPESDEVKFLLSVRAGLRAAEIAGLTMADVLNADGTIGAVIHVGRRIAKGGKERMIPLHPQLKHALERLRAAYPDARYLSFSQRRQPRRQSPQAVTQWFWRFYAELGLEGCSSHSGRRTFITNLARLANERDYSLRDVQQLAGHARLDTTAAYIDPAANLGLLVASLGQPTPRPA